MVFGEKRTYGNAREIDNLGSLEPSPGSLETIQKANELKPDLVVLAPEFSKTHC
jgi:hypothetical protein